ncbi:hypothetical protein ACA910_005177 [Epithemia clementina (nom. ined.)]
MLHSSFLLRRCALPQASATPTAAFVALRQRIQCGASSSSWRGIVAAAAAAASKSVPNHEGGVTVAQRRLFSSTTATTTTTTTTNASTTTQTSAMAPPLFSMEFYQYAICPFCNKTKAFLKYAKIPYTAIEVNPLTKAELRWSKDYRKVPMARATTPVAASSSSSLSSSSSSSQEAPTVVWKGSDAIVQGLLEQDWVLEQLQHQWKAGNSPMTLSDFVGRVAATTNDDDTKPKGKALAPKDAQEWVRYANEELAVLLYPNLCPTLGRAYQAFAYVHTIPTFSFWQQWSIRTVGSLAMYLAASRVKRKHKIDNERQALTLVLEKPIQQLSSSSSSSSSNSGLFLSGLEEPHLGDLAVYGALRGIHGTPVHDEIWSSSKDSRVLKDWYERMQAKVES